MQNFASGWAYGTGAALNVQVGWIPDRVEVFDVTNGTLFNVGFPSRTKMAFTSGGTNEIKAGHWLIGATSKARARVMAVLADTGTWAGGDAAGTIILDAEGATGTFESESVYYEGSSGTDDATGALDTNTGYDSDSEIATDTGISAYDGTEAANSKGFTLATAVSVDATLLAWSAWRNTS